MSPLQKDLINLTNSTYNKDCFATIKPEYRSNCIDIICYEFDIEKSDLLSKSRKRLLVELRHMLFSYIKKNTTYSLAHIGSFFGDRDHATVLHGLKSHNNKLDTKDKMYILLYNKFKKALI